METGDVPAVTQLKLLQLLIELRSNLREFGYPRKMLIRVLRKAIDILGADEGAVFLLASRTQVAEVLYSIPNGADWNLGLLNDYIKSRRPQLPADIVVARVRRRARGWGAIALRFGTQEVDVHHVRSLWAIADVVSEAIEEYDGTRVDVLRRRIEHKVANRQRPKDIIYDILHGIRDLIRYDHSATFWLSHSPNGPLELIAEQIAWTKAKSKRIGQKVTVDDRVGRQLRVPGVRLFSRDGPDWKAQKGDEDPIIAELLDRHSGDGAGQPLEVAMLCTVVATPDGSVGVLEVASQDIRALGRFEAAVLERLMPLMSLALQFLHRTTELEEQILTAERKYALANLTRGIAHDVNNALGSVLPLVQQIRSDVTRQELDTKVLADDLAVIESGLQTCRRIFSGMLASARSSDRSLGNGNLRRAIDSAVNVLQNRLRRQSVTLEADVPSELPTLRGNQGDIIQVFLNLFSNALDALGDGGQLRVTAREMGQSVSVTIEDTGKGIPEAVLPTVFDPFVTTKVRGNGLGLSICRSIMWELGGEMDLSSAPDKGTKVALKLPIQRDRDEGCL